jgi:hypothetical protein
VARGGTSAVLLGISEDVAVDDVSDHDASGVELERLTAGYDSRLIDPEPTMLGAGAHLLAVGRRSGGS